MSRGRSSSLFRAGSALAIVLALGACTSGGQFDPTEVLSTDVFNSKKKLSGEREPLFPQGVPGAETGVPPDLVKGYQPPPEPVAAADAGGDAAAKTAAAAEKPSPSRNPSRRLRVPRHRKRTILFGNRRRHRRRLRRQDNRRNLPGRPRRQRNPGRPTGLRRRRPVNPHKRHPRHKPIGRPRRRCGKRNKRTGFASAPARPVSTLPSSG